jgi:release factor glutamine methyltransferase
MRVLVPPGVFRPRSDSWLLADTIRALTRPGMRVLDLCTGSGVVALAAGQAGAAEVVAIDVSRRAALTVRLNARLNGLPVDVRRGDLLDPVAGEQFDLIASNPPYLPTPDSGRPVRGLARAWEGGWDGRRFLDAIIAAAPGHLRPGGALVLIHSSVCGLCATEQALANAGLRPEVLVRQRGQLGPLLAARARTLEERRLLRPGKREEEVAVFVGTKATAAACGL